MWDKETYLQTGQQSTGIFKMEITAPVLCELKEKMQEPPRRWVVGAGDRIPLCKPVKNSGYYMLRKTNKKLPIRTGEDNTPYPTLGGGT